MSFCRTKPRFRPLLRVVVPQDIIYSRFFYTRRSVNVNNFFLVAVHESSRGGRYHIQWQPLTGAVIKARARTGREVFGPMEWLGSRKNVDASIQQYVVIIQPISMDLNIFKPGVSNCRLSYYFCPARVIFWNCIVLTFEFKINFIKYWETVNLYCIFDVL